MENKNNVTVNVSEAAIAAEVQQPVQQATPVAPVTTDAQVPVPVEPVQPVQPVQPVTAVQQESLGSKIWNTVKKPLAIVGGIGAGVGALFLAFKAGESNGALEALSNLPDYSGGGDSDESSDDDSDAE